MSSDRTRTITCQWCKSEVPVTTNFLHHLIVCPKSPDTVKDQARQSKVATDNMSLSVDDGITTPAEMRAILNDSAMSELQLHQRMENSQRWSLIHNLLYQGRHEHARQVANLPEHHEHIDGHEAAIKKPDDEKCECAFTPSLDQMTQHQEIGRGWSEDHKQIVVHYRCSQCATVNATPQPPSIAHDIVNKYRRINAAAAKLGNWDKRWTDEQILDEVKQAIAAETAPKNGKPS